MSFEDSAYSHFVRKRRECITTENKFNLYVSEYLQGIECTLWPHLYPKKSWCETTIKGNNSHLSTKVAFFIKVFSSILDYAIDFELLKFHYDVWLFKIVSGTISAARKLHWSPVMVLNAKAFSPGYWKRQHRLLQDAVGRPALRCRMDLQFSNGNDMYQSGKTVIQVRDYSVNKHLHSKLRIDTLETNVCEPEMWLYMSSIKMSWTSSRTKEFCPPKTEQSCQTATYTKYLACGRHAENLSFLQWLHSYQHTHANPHCTKVAIHFSLSSVWVSFQELLMNYLHRNLSSLFIPNYKDYPEQFCYFSCGVVKRDSQWATLDAAKIHFGRHGHRDYCINNLLSHIASQHNMLNLWHRGILNRTNFIQSMSTMTTHPLDSHQTAIFNQIVQAMNDHNEQ